MPDQFEPAEAFAEFFEGDSEFMDEVFWRFGSLGLSMVGHGGGAGSEELIGNVSLGPRTTHLFGKPNNPCSIFKQTLFKIVGGFVLHS